MKTSSAKLRPSILTSPISFWLKPLSLLPATAAMLAFPFNQSARAATVTWTGPSGGDWVTGTNWLGSAKPNPADTALFNTALSSVAIGSAQTITSISFDTLSGTSGATFTVGTLGGAALTGSNGGTIQITGSLSGSAKNFTINAPFVITPASAANTGGYTFQNNSADPTNTLNFAGPVTSATTTSTTTLTLTGSNTGANTISGSITSGSAAAFALTKNGAGTWILTGANNYNGATSITGGTLQYSGANGANAGTGAIQLWAGTLAIDNTGVLGNNINRIADTAALTLYAGTFLYKGSDQTTNSTETVGAISQGLGSGVLTVSYGGSNLATLTGTSFVHTVGNGTALINGVNLGKNNTDAGSVGKLILNSAPTLIGTTAAVTSGLNAASQNTKIVPFLLGEAVAGTGGLGTATGTANTFVTYIAGSGVRPLNPTDEFTNNAITAGNNTYITLSSTAAASAAINSLVINGSDLSIADGQTLTNTSGALLFASSNAVKPAGTTGALNFGSGVEGMITVNAGVTGTIGSNITANGANALTISGAGTLVLAGSNSYTGTTNFGNAGSTLVLGSKYALGSGTAIMSLNGANSSYNATPAMAATIIALTDMSGTNALTNPFYFNTGNSGTAIVAGSNNITFSGPVTDAAYNLSLQNSLSNGATLTISGSIIVPSNRGFNISGSGNTMITGNVSAHNGGTISSTGTTTLSGSDASTGVYTLSAGVLAVGSAYATGTAGFSPTGGTVQAAVDLSAGLANFWTLNGNLTVSGTNSLKINGTTTNYNNNRILTSSIAPGSGVLTLAGNVYLSQDATNNRIFTIAGTGNTLISGTIANYSGGSGIAEALTITNTGTTTLSGPSTFTGAFNQTGAGTVAVTGTMNGPSSFTVNNASAVFNESATGALQGAAASFTLTNGTASLSAPNSYGGGTTLTVGLLNLGDKGALGSGPLLFNGGTLAALSPLTGANAVGNAVSLGGNGTIQGTNNLQLGGAITNSGSNYTLTSSIAPASGTLTLAGNVYLSESAASSRTLTLAGTGNTVISGTVANNSTLSGSAGSLTITNTGGTTLSGQCVFTGAFNQTGAGTVAVTGTMNGPSSFTVNNASAVFNESATGALQGAAASFTLTNGTANLSAPNSYGGGTTLTAGLLNLGDKGALGSGTAVLNGGALGALTPLTGANAVANNTTLGGNVTIQGNNSLELSGTMFQTNSRTLTNNISGAGSSLIISGPVVSTGAYTLTGAGSGLTTISGLISATNTLTYAGSGTMQLTNPGNTFTGVIKASSGKLKLAPTGASLTSTNQFQSNVGAILEFGGDAGNNNLLADITGLGNTQNLGLNLFTSGTWTSNIGSVKSDLTVDGASLIIAANRLSLSGTGAAGTIAFNMKSGSLATTSAATYGLRLNCYNGSAVGASLPFSGTQSGGLVTIINPSGGTTQGFALGGTSTSVVSSYTMTGGTMNVIGSGANGYLSLGADAAGTSTTTFAFSGGRLYVSAGIEGESAGANQIFNFTGGSLAAATITATNLRAPGDSANGTFTENGAGALLDVSGTNTTVTGNFTMLSGSAQIGAARTLTVSGALNGSQGAVITGIASGTGTLSVAPATSSTFAGVIQDGSGKIALTKSGAGSLTLTGSNSYTGTTTISAGTLQIGDGTAGNDGTNASASIVNQTALVYNLFGNQTYAGAISGTGSVGKFGAGTLTLTGSNSFTGPMTVNSGTVQIGNGTTGALSGTSAVTVNGGATLALNLAGSGTLANSILLSGSYGAAASLNLLGGGTTAILGNITGTVYGSVTQTGTGTTILLGNNSLFGTLNINAGAIQLSGSYSAYSSVVNVNANNGLVFGMNTMTIGGLGGSGNFALVNGTNAVVLTASNAYSDTVYSGAMSGNGSLTKAGSHMLTLSGSSSYTGATNINGGVLAINAANNIGDGSATNTLSFSGGTLESTANTYDLGANRSILLNGAGTLQADAGTLTVSGSIAGANTFTVTGSGNVNISGMIATGAGSIVKSGAGTLLLSSSNSYTGGTTITSGSVQLGNNYGLGSTAGNLTLNGGTLDLNGYVGTVAALNGGLGASITNDSATSGTIAVVSGSFGGVISDGAGQTYLVKQGASTTVLTLTGNNTFTGSAIVAAGTVAVSNIGNAGTPGNLGAAPQSTGSSAPIQIANGGVLQYTGPGETSNRCIFANLADGWIGSIAANGTGALILSGSIVSLNHNATQGAEWIVLNGTSTNLNTLSGAMTDIGGNHISLSKQGAGTWLLSGTRSYTAVTDVENGILQFDSIANKSAACSLGTASYQYAFLPSINKSTSSGQGTALVPYQIALGSGSTSGILQYVGSSNGSSNRQFGLNGNGAISTASGAGTLTLSGTIAPAVSSNVTISLDANNAGANTASGVIADLQGASTTVSTTGSSNASFINVASTAGFSIGQTLSTGTGLAANTVILGITSGTLFVGPNTSGTVVNGATITAGGAQMAVAKTGPGTWILSGSNTYSGGTTVTSGSLQIGNANALGTGGLTVNGGALDLHGYSVSVVALSGSGGSVTNMGSGTSTLTATAASGTATYVGNIADGTGAVVLTNSGAGTLILSGSLAMTGLNADNGVTQLAQSGSIKAVTVAAGATVSLAAHSGGNYNVLNVSALTISGFTSSLGANNEAVANVAYTPVDATGQTNAGVLTNAGVAGTQATASTSAVEPASPEAVPEPGMLGMLLAGALGMLGLRRQRKDRD